MDLSSSLAPPSQKTRTPSRISPTFRVGEIRVLLHTAAPPRLGVGIRGVLGQYARLLVCCVVLDYTVTSATTTDCCSWIVGRGLAYLPHCLKLVSDRVFEVNSEESV